MLRIVALAILLLAAPASAATIEGRAFAIDARTIAVLTPGKTVLVRLQGIEVPQDRDARALAWQTLGRMVLPEIVSCEIADVLEWPAPDVIFDGVCRIGRFDLSLSMIHLRVADRMPSRQQ